jgi:hypothetical protein
MATIIPLFPSQLRSFKHVAIRYQSTEDWREAIDHARCNPSFHGHQRLDWVAVNMNIPGELSFGRLYALIECRFNRETCRVALVCMSRPSNWKPNTVWDGCKVLEESFKKPGPLFVDPGTFIRAAHLIPVMNVSRPNLYYLNDTIDLDWFLRVGN